MLVLGLVLGGMVVSKKDCNGGRRRGHQERGDFKQFSSCAGCVDPHLNLGTWGIWETAYWLQSTVHLPGVGTRITVQTLNGKCSYSRG